MFKSKSRFIAFICNIIISALCVTSIGSYFVLPFWKVEASYRIDKATLRSLLEETLQNAEDDGTKIEISEADLNELGEPIIPLSISLKTTDVLSSLSGNAEETVNQILNVNVDSAVNGVMPELQKITKSVVKITSKSTIKETVKETVKDAILNKEGEKSDEELNNRVTEVLDSAGVTDEYISDKTDELVDLIYSANATVDNVAEKAAQTVDEVFNKLKNSEDDVLQDLNFSEEDKEELKDTMKDVLSNIANEDGTIDVNQFISGTLSSLLKGNGENNEGNRAETGVILTNSSISAGNDSTDQPKTEDSTEELKAALREKIEEMIPENAVEQICNILKYVSYVLLFTFFTWGYLILKILVKLTAKNNAIKLGLPIWLGWLPYLVLCLIPNGVIALLKNPPAFVANTLGADTMATLAKTFSSLTIQFSSGAWISFVVAIAFLLFALFFYRPLRKKLKKIAKGELAEVKSLDEINAEIAAATKTDEEESKTEE